MPLKYPTVRLFMFNKLKGQEISCTGACVEAAYEFGIIRSGSLDAWLERDKKDSSSCGTMEACRKILEQFFEENDLDDSKPVKTGNGSGRLGPGSAGAGCGPVSHERMETAWTDFLSDISRYSNGMEKKESCSICSRSGTDSPIVAPIVIDLLLQQISRY